LRSLLRFDAANNDFLLDRTVGGAIFETARFGGMASQLWYESADAVAAQLDTERDGRRGRGLALWLQGWTGERERGGSQTLAGAGTFDVSFDQDFQGLQGGLDFQAGSGVIGITGGTGRSDAAFAATGNPVDMKVSNVGLYAQLRAGPFFFNALAKRDWAELDIDPGAGLGAEFDADLFGVQANAGLRLGSGAVFAEPSVGLSWVQADLDSFESGPATVEPGDADSLRARAGLRVGARLPLGGGTLQPFVAANAYEELGGRNASDFTLGETLRLFDEPAGTRGEAQAGLSFVSAGFEAFVRGEMDFSGGTDAKAVRAGARLRF
jgi:outer membrane autotransporter protein